MKFAAILCLVLAVSVAYADEEADVATYRGRKASTAWDIISNEPMLTTLATLIQANNLIAALDDPRHPVTVFAPTDAALDALGAALPAGTPLAGPLVTNILLQHVTRSKVPPFMRARRSVPSLNAGNPITRVTTGKTGKSRVSSWMGGQGNVVNSTRYIKAKKAAVLIIDGVILPNNAFASIEAAAVFWNYTAFAGTVVATNPGLLDTANAPVPQKTVFAPSNTAFAAVEDIVAELEEDVITAVLQYHVSLAVVTTPFTNSTIATLLEQNLTLVAPTTVVAAGSTATVVTPNIWFPGGVLQGIDEVLIPILG